MPSVTKTLTVQVLIQRFAEFIDDLVDMTVLGNELWGHNGVIAGKLDVATVPEQVFL